MKAASAAAFVEFVWLLAGPAQQGLLCGAVSTRASLNSALHAVGQQQQQRRLRRQPDLRGAVELAAAEPPRGLDVETDLFEECLEVPTAICVQDVRGSSFVISRTYAPPELQIWYQFDKSLPVDDSGKKRHLVDAVKALKPLAAGPGVMGRGASARFDGTSYREVPASAEGLNSQAITVTLWIYLLEDSVGAWRTIFNRGSRAEEMAPALLLNPNSRRLHVRAAVRAEGPNGALDSTGELPLRRWTHISVIVTAGVIRLYINGMRDSEVILEEPLTPNEGSLYLGRDPWRRGVKAFVDDFRWYSRELRQNEVQSLLFPGLTGSAASEHIFLGCASCRFPEATRACNDQAAHVCSMQEHFSGAFHTARAMGWLTPHVEVWHHEAEGDEVFNGKTKLGLCCMD